MSVARSSSGMFATGRIAYRREGIFLPIDNALYNTLATKNHSIANNVMQHKGSFRRCRVRWKWDQPGRGWRECRAQAKCNLRLPCFLCFCNMCLMWRFQTCSLYMRKRKGSISKLKFHISLVIVEQHFSYSVFEPIRDAVCQKTMSTWKRISPVHCRCWA